MPGTFPLQPRPGGENIAPLPTSPRYPPPEKTGPTTRLRPRLLFAHAMLGSGKAELLERIREAGSIPAAGRTMNMSYKRAWMLVEEMNAAFRALLVARARGGPGSGGAHLTEVGDEALRRYCAVAAATTASAGANDIAALERMLRTAPAVPGDIPDQKLRLPPAPCRD